MLNVQSFVGTHFIPFILFGSLLVSMAILRQEQMWSRWEGSLSETPVLWLISRCDSGSNLKSRLDWKYELFYLTASLTRKAEMGCGAEQFKLTLLSTLVEWRNIFLFRNISWLIDHCCFLEALNRVAMQKPLCLLTSSTSLSPFFLLLFLDYLYHLLFLLQ